MLADLSAQSKKGLDELIKSDVSSFSATVEEYMRVIASIKVRCIKDTTYLLIKYLECIQHENRPVPRYQSS